MESSSVVIAVLVIAGKVSKDEANILQRRLVGTEIPQRWEGVVDLLEYELDRKLYE